MNTYEDYILKEECYQVIGCCMNVHNELGCGFLEPVYQEALSIELGLKNIPFEKEKELEIIYKGHVLMKKYFADFVCYNKLIVELKAVKELAKEHTSQLLNYLHATGNRVGLLINFGSAKLEFKRVII
ncbi:MAG: GxxExxY protein [Bacteroidetes bacterium]|nr:MAG: GxxExxY protein [Bacteroidota bacterium]